MIVIALDEKKEWKNEREREVNLDLKLVKCRNWLPFLLMALLVVELVGRHSPN